LASQCHRRCRGCRRHDRVNGLAAPHTRLLTHASEGGTPHSRKVLEGRRANPLGHAYVLGTGPGECLAPEFPPARNWLSAHS
jgi:hypothetical protein